ncbi:MAG TPA: class I SAM-dependent methyltransferase [Thermoanaerobaculia bacterium]|nr:class I SAM-dependent methyltransferase [Thermoanaerobaculia bacterium]
MVSHLLSSCRFKKRLLERDLGFSLADSPVMPHSASLESHSSKRARGHSSGEVRGYYRHVAPFYDLELADRGDEALWLWAAGSPAGCRVLELGAGTGRATAFFACKAAWVVATELAPEMIVLARRRLAGAANVSLVLADMRELELQARFDLVAAVDDPFVHLTADEDRQRAFAAAARHLAPGGRFILDGAWFPPHQRRAAAMKTGLIEEHGSRGLEVRQTWHCDPQTHLCDASFEYSRRGERLEEASFPARLWSHEELTDRARAAGLRVTHLWGDYDRRPWDRMASPHLIVEMRLG